MPEHVGLTAPSCIVIGATNTHPSVYVTESEHPMFTSISRPIAIVLLAAVSSGCSFTIKTNGLESTSSPTTTEAPNNSSASDPEVTLSPPSNNALSGSKTLSTYGLSVRVQDPSWQVWKTEEDEISPGVVDYKITKWRMKDAEDGVVCEIMLGYQNHDKKPLEKIVVMTGNWDKTDPNYYYGPDPKPLVPEKSETLRADGLQEVKLASGKSDGAEVRGRTFNTPHGQNVVFLATSENGVDPKCSLKEAADSLTWDGKKFPTAS